MKKNKLITALMGITGLGLSAVALVTNGACSHNKPSPKINEITALTDNANINNNRGTLVPIGDSDANGMREISFNTYSASQLVVGMESVKSPVTWWYSYGDGTYDRHGWAWSNKVVGDLNSACGFNVIPADNLLLFNADCDRDSCHFKSFWLKCEYQENNEHKEATPILVHFHNAPELGSAGSGKIIEVDNNGYLDKFTPDASSTKYDVIFIPATYNNKSVAGISNQIFEDRFDGKANTFCKSCDNIVFADRDEYNTCNIASSNFTADVLVLGDIYIGTGEYVCASFGSVSLFSTNRSSSNSSFHVAGNIDIVGNVSLDTESSTATVAFFSAQSEEKNASVTIDGSVNIKGAINIKAPRAYDIFCFTAFTNEGGANATLNINGDINLDNDCNLLLNNSNYDGAYFFSAYCDNDPSLFISRTVFMDSLNMVVVSENSYFFYGQNKDRVGISYKNTTFKSKNGTTPHMNVTWITPRVAPEWHIY